MIRQSISYWPGQQITSLTIINYNNDNEWLEFNGERSATRASVLRLWVADDTERRPNEFRLIVDDRTTNQTQRLSVDDNTSTISLKHSKQRTIIMRIYYMCNQSRHCRNGKNSS